MKIKSDTKQLIFNAAAELFSERGFHAVSIQDIAKKVGVRKSNIYNHYPSKEAILDALLDHYTNRMKDFFDETRTENLRSAAIANQDLKTLLRQFLLVFYRPEEEQLMYHLTRIVHHEQFTSPKAADALIGSGYRRWANSHIQGFDMLINAGYLPAYFDKQMYGELFARISLTFATQFLHPEFEHTIGTQGELYEFMIDRIVAQYQTTK